MIQLCGPVSSRPAAATPRSLHPRQSLRFIGMGPGAGVPASVVPGPAPSARTKLERARIRGREAEKVNRKASRVRRGF
jgi:hypothetical protein